MEIKAREFEAKILFACFAVERGYQVVLGQRQSLYEEILPVAPRSILIEHDVTAAHRDTFPKIQRLGHAIVAWDEEAIAQPSKAWYLSRRVAVDVLQATQAHFAWGNQQRDWVVSACPSYKERIHASGNPRIDLLRPEFSSFFQHEAGQHQERYGRYVLINSNFNRVNLFHGNRQQFIESVSKAAELSAEMTSFYRDFVGYSEQTFFKYIELLPLLSAALEGTQIVIRPHPAEDPEPWRKAVAGLPNVHVLYEGSANGWIRGASALVHSGCTTAIEAAVLGVPVVEYAPIDNEQFSLQLPRLLSRRIHTPSELIACLRTHLGGGQSLPVSADVGHPIHDYLASLGGEFASNVILAHLDGVETDKGSMFHRLESKLRFHARRMLGRPERPETSGVRYAKHKFPNTSLSEVQEIVARMRVVSRRFSNVDVSELTENCFKFQSANL